MIQSVNKHSFTSSFHIVIIFFKVNVFFLPYRPSEDCSEILGKSVDSGHLFFFFFYIYMKWKHLMFYLSTYRFIVRILNLTDDLLFLVGMDFYHEC